MTIIVSYGKKRPMHGVEMGNISYDIELKVEGSHWWFVVRRRLLKSILSTLHLPLGCIALDIGCGVGSNLRTSGSAGLNVIGLDRSIYALHLVRKRFKFPLINADLNSLPIKNQSIGLIIAMDILEHIEDDSNGIREFYRALKEGGILFSTVPAFQFLRGTQDIVTGHKRRYSRKEILAKLRGRGFTLVRTSYFNFFLFFPIFFIRRMIHILGIHVESENQINFPFINFLFKIIFYIEPYILKYFPFPFGVSIFCVAKK